MTRTTIALILFMLAALLPAAAIAQTPLPSSAGRAVSWHDGLVIQSPSARSQIVVTGALQVDGRAPVDRPVNAAEAISLRTARVAIAGRLTKSLEFRVTSGATGTTPSLFSAYVDLVLAPTLRVRVGKDKTPVGYEQLLSTFSLLFPDRTSVSGLLPSRDVGLQVQGDAAKGAMSYAAGVFSGVADGSSVRRGEPLSPGQDLAGRVIVRPWRASDRRWLKGLGGHVGGSVGRDAGVLPAFKTPGGRTFFSYAADARAGGGRTRVTPAVFYYKGPFGGFAEYARSAQEVARAGERQVIAHHAWGVSGSVVLTGEAATERGVRPRRSFEPLRHQWGALQAVARYSRFTVDRRVFPGDLASPKADAGAATMAAGLDWYPRTYVRYSVVVERTSFVPGVSVANRPERIVWVRAQFAM